MAGIQPLQVEIAGYRCCRLHELHTEIVTAQWARGILDEPGL